MYGMWYTFDRTQSIVVPFCRVEKAVRTIRWAITKGVGPISHTVMRSVHAGNKTNPRRSAYRRRVRIGKFHPFAGKTLHIRSVIAPVQRHDAVAERRSEEHTSELQSLMRISYAVFCLKKKKYTY